MFPKNGVKRDGSIGERFSLSRKGEQKEKLFFKNKVKREGSKGERFFFCRKGEQEEKFLFPKNGVKKRR